MAGFVTDTIGLQTHPLRVTSQNLCGCHDDNQDNRTHDEIGVAPAISRYQGRGNQRHYELAGTRADLGNAGHHTPMLLEPARYGRQRYDIMRAESDTHQRPVQQVELPRRLHPGHEHVAESKRNAGHDHEDPRANFVVQPAGQNSGSPHHQKG